MGLFDIISDVKDNMDRRKEARENIHRAKELVREGKEIYENAYGKVILYACETENKLRKHTDYKKQIAKELDGTIGSTLKDFARFDIDAKTIAAPTIREPVVQEPLMNFQSALSGIVSQRIETSIFDLFISDEDYYEARRQRDEAKHYKECMKMEREKLYAYKEKMSEIRSFISSEKYELDSLMEKLRYMTNELKVGMKKSSFSVEETKFLKGIHKISEHITTLLSTKFLSDPFSISQHYQEVFSGIKDINQCLPISPSVSDGNTAAAIKRILEIVIVN